MKLSEYLFNKLNGQYWVSPRLVVGAIERVLKEGNFDIEVTEPNSNLVPFTYIEMHHDDASVMANILRDKLSDWQEELEIMKEFDAGNEELWCHLPRTLMTKAFDGESVKENIDPWISQIQWAEHMIKKFKEASVKSK